MEEPAPAPSDSAAESTAALQHLPHSLIAAVLAQMISAPVNAPAAQPPDGDGAAANTAGVKAAVYLAFSCRALMEAVAAAELLWQQQCQRLGWRWTCARQWVCLGSAACPPLACSCRPNMKGRRHHLRPPGPLQLGVAHRSAPYHFLLGLFLPTHACAACAPPPTAGGGSIHRPAVSGGAATAGICGSHTTSRGSAAGVSAGALSAGVHGRR